MPKRRATGAAADWKQSEGGEKAAKRRKGDEGSGSKVEVKAAPAVQCHLYRLPDAVLLAMVHDYLTGSDVQSLVATSKQFVRPLRNYRIREVLSVGTALALIAGRPTALRSGAVTRASKRMEWQFGVPTRVRLADPNVVAAWRRKAQQLHAVRQLDVSLSTFAAVSLQRLLPPQLRSLRFRYPRGVSLANVPWPASLTELLDVSSVEPPSQWALLPDGLRVLTFGYFFDYPLDGLQLPDSLTELRLGAYFNHPLSNVAMPKGLRTLQLGQRDYMCDSRFSHALADLRGLAALTELNIYSRDFNHPVSDIAFPPTLRSFRLHSLAYSHPLHLHHLPSSCSEVSVMWPRSADQKVDWSHLQLPDTVRMLKVDTLSYNVVSLETDPRYHNADSFTTLTLPSRLTDLHLMVRTTASLFSVKWPSQLRSLTFGGDPYGVIDGRHLPPSLTSLKVVWWGGASPRPLPPDPIHLTALHQLTLLHLGPYQRELRGDMLPSSLTELRLSDRWLQPADGLILPPRLQVLRTTWYFNRPLDGIVLPPSLTAIIFNNDFDQSLDGLHFPPALHTLSFGTRFSQSLHFVSTLRSLQRLQLENPDFPLHLLPASWPASLRVLAAPLKLLKQVKALLPAHVGTSSDMMWRNS